MRFRHRDGTVIHLAYGTNVHPAESVEGLAAQMTKYGAGIRNELGADVLGLGLWLPAEAARVLAQDPAQAHRIRGLLHRHGLEVVTINAFPYARFHAPRVKGGVYQPDWTDRARLTYTLDCAKVLATLLPDDADCGSISTLPLGWRTPWGADRQHTARAHLDELTEGLAKIASDGGRPVRVGIEPEPGCVVETTRDAIERLADVDTEYIGVCLDTCHLATGFEEPETALAQLDAAGLAVVKAQPSAALHAEQPQSEKTRAALSQYAEDRFLHQVRERRGLHVARRDDLDAALAGDCPLPGEEPWRVHFHVPVHTELEPPLTSTRDTLVSALRGLVGGSAPRTDHLEVETYTWGVLPPGQRPVDDDDLVAGLAGELRWTADRLTELGLEVA